MTFNIRRLLSRVRRAVDDYRMIEEGDRIAVGVSGGKDSLALLIALAELRRFYPKSFEVVAITVDMGFEGGDFSSLEEFYNTLGVPFKIVKTNLAEIIFDIRKEPNPCSLCARMRRGILHDTAREFSCNKLALGHHYDDVLETFMMNLCNEGRLGTFSPVTYLDRQDITVIRPFVLTKESEIIGFANHHTLSIIKSLCPEDKVTDREYYKGLLADLEARREGLRHRMFTAIVKADLSGYGVEDKPKPKKKKNTEERKTQSENGDE